MQIIHCGATAFTPLTQLEQIADSGFYVEVEDLCGQPVEGSFFLRKAETTEEIVYPITDGKCLVPGTALKPAYRYVMGVVCGGARMPAGYIDVLDVALMGKCVYPVRDDKNHIWGVCTAIVDLLRETREKLDNHVDGTEVI